jgi:hypothetical protein
MADSEFYKHDRPPDATLPEDRPRGGGPEDFSPAGRKTWPFFIILAVVVLLLIIFMTV